jgi:signal transduction histidine kinase
MKLTDFKYQNSIPKFSLKNSWKAMAVLLVGLLLTFEASYYTKNKVKEIANQDFKFICNDLKIKLDARLKAHAQLLRSSAAFFATSDTVTREQWRKFNESEKISKNLPGIQGVGYSLIIPKNQLTHHIQSFRKNGFPDYNVIPVGDRGIYTSIVYLEPFSGRNLRAFGYDMFSEPVRRKAMEISRDSDYAMLSGKVILVQETNEDVQAGSLMYVPVYRNGMQTNTVEERRAAIKGWVYSPYRMNDLTNGILGNWDLPYKNRIHLKIFDNNDIPDEALLYDSQSKDKIINKGKPNLYLKLPIEFNGKYWILQFTGNNKNLSVLHGEILIVLISGITISFLLFALTLALINTKIRARQIQLLNNQLEKLNTDKDRFLSILGHDLRSPFNALLNLSELLKDNIRQYNIGEIENFVNHLNKSAQSTYNLLEDILLWARTQSGKIPFKPQMLSFADICKNILEIVKPNADSKNITINCFIADHIIVFADIDMLKTVLRNLVSNSIKFTNNGGVININAEENSGNVTISVSDNGIGIAPDDLTKLFDISQVHTTEGTASEKGTGLGLLLCKEFVEKHGGKIWVESKIGKGSDFKFTLQKFTDTINSTTNR